MGLWGWCLGFVLDGWCRPVRPPPPLPLEGLYLLRRLHTAFECGIATMAWVIWAWWQDELGTGRAGVGLDGAGGRGRLPSAQYYRLADRRQACTFPRNPTPAICRHPFTPAGAVTVGILCMAGGGGVGLRSCVPEALDTCCIQGYLGALGGAGASGLRCLG